MGSCRPTHAPLPALLLAAIALLGAGPPGEPVVAADVPPLRIVVMDPLAAPLACECVEGYAQRRYDLLGSFLQERLGREVQVFYGESLAHVTARRGRDIDLIIGKESVVRFDATQAGLDFRIIARLTDTAGSTDCTGLFVVRGEDAARNVVDLKGRTIILGPEDAAEKSAAAVLALKAAGVPAPDPAMRRQGCNVAAVAVVENEADAAVISSYALALLIGCDAIAKGAVRVIGETAPVPFVTVFATGCVTPAQEEDIVAALLAVRRHASLLDAMESLDGFVTAGPAGKPPARVGPGVEWTDWRGPGRRGLSPHVPQALPEQIVELWRHPLSGLGHAGLAATHDRVLVADKDAEMEKDVWRCLDANTGRELWRIEYPAPEQMDYGNCPRANPVIHDAFAYLLGAFGDLHCVELATGRVAWRRNVVEEFGAELVMWGMCSAPLVVDDKLIVNPGAPDASLVALDLKSGRTVWTTPGSEAAYASFIVGEFGGVRQIVGYDAISLGGWNPDTGERLWTLIPDEPGDFNVPTPIEVDGKLLVITENNGARLYGFETGGKIIPRPASQNMEIAHDTVTPVLHEGMVYGSSESLFCLDAADGLKLRWQADDEAYAYHTAIIAGNGRLLIVTEQGELSLVAAEPGAYRILARRKLFEDGEVYAHPAIVGNRLYVRNFDAVVCLLIATPGSVGAPPAVGQAG